MRDFAADLSLYKKSFNEPVQETTETITNDEESINTSLDNSSSEPSQSDNQTLVNSNVRKLTLNNPNVPKQSNPFVTQAAA